MKETGIDCVLLQVEIQRALREEKHLEECGEFIALLGKHGLSTIVLLGTTGAKRSLEVSLQQAAIDWLIKLKSVVQEGGGALQEVDGRLLCMLEPDIAVWRAANPKVLIQRIPSPTPSASLSLPVSAERWLFITVPSSSDARVPGQPVPSLKERLCAIEPEKPVDTVCLVAWNDFKRDRVLEPNTRDGTTRTDALSEWASTAVKPDVE